MGATSRFLPPLLTFVAVVPNHREQTQVQRQASGQPVPSVALGAAHRSGVTPVTPKKAAAHGDALADHAFFARPPSSLDQRP